MTPFVAAEPLPDLTLTPEALMEKFGVSRKEAEHTLNNARTCPLFINDVYQVAVFFDDQPHVIQAFGCPIVHLSIKRRDRAPIHDWRDLQRIKNVMVGNECEGFEIYPAESRLVDTANQYHLWVLTDPNIRIPIGFQSRMVDDAPIGKAVQRPFDK